MLYAKCEMLCMYQDGAYSMDLLIGDNALDVPVIWPLGTVAVSHQADEGAETGLTAINAFFGPKPEIVHLQRTPGRRPPSAVSVLFTVLALAPLLLLYTMLSSVGANLKVCTPLLDNSHSCHVHHLAIELSWHSTRLCKPVGCQNLMVMPQDCATCQKLVKFFFFFCHVKYCRNALAMTSMKPTASWHVLSCCSKGFCYDTWQFRVSS